MPCETVSNTPPSICADDSLGGRNIPTSMHSAMRCVLETHQSSTSETDAGRLPSVEQCRNYPAPRQPVMLG